MWIEIGVTILFSAVKFAMTFPLVILQFQFSFVETILWTNVGGILGIYFFAYLSARLISWWNRTFRKPLTESSKSTTDSTKIFTKRNRRIVRIKQQYGLIGIAVSTPFLLSIPVGAFLVVRYYRSVKTKFLYLIAANLLWSLIYAGFYFFWNIMLFKKA